MTHQSDREAWLLARMEAFGGSDVPRLLCEAPAKNEGERLGQRGQLVMEKAGLAEPFAGNESTRLGELLEPAVIGIARDVLGMALVPCGVWQLHKDLPRLGCTPDALWYPGASNQPIPVNIKFTSAQAQEDCRPTKKDGTPSGAAFAAGLPLYYRVQAICEAMVLNASHAVMLVMHASGGLKLRAYCQPRHAALEARIRAEVLSAWADVTRLREGKAA